jgi:transposase-like protein
MSEKGKKQHSEVFKFKVAFAALKGDKTMASLCKEFSLHETQISRWKKALRDNGSSIFGASSKPNAKEEELKQQIKQLNEYIGEITVENKFLKKNLSL